MLCIRDKEVEIVNSFKYLGLTIDSTLSFSAHVQNVYSNCQKRLYILRQLRSFRVDKKLLKVMYETLVESLLSYGNICYHGQLSLRDKNNLTKIVKIASKIIGLPVNSLDKCSEKNDLP